MRDNNGIQLIEEKFRLEMFNSISNIIYPKPKPHEKTDITKDIQKDSKEGKDSFKSDK